MICSLTHSTIITLHFKVFVNFPNYLLLLVYNLMRNIGEKPVMPVCFGLLIRHGIVAVDLCLMMKGEFISTIVLQRVTSVHLTKLLRDSPQSGPFICSIFSVIMKSPITYYKNVNFIFVCCLDFLCVFWDCEFRFLYEHNCCISLTA